MESTEMLSEKQSNSIIMEGDDIIETSVEEVVISEGDEHQRNKFYISYVSISSFIIVTQMDNGNILWLFRKRTDNLLKEHWK